MSEPAIKSGPAITAGSLVSSTFSIWSRNFLPFFALTLIVYLPMVALSLYSALSLELTQDGIERLTMLGIIEVFLGMICASALSGATCYGTMESLRGRAVAFGQVLSNGLSRSLAVVGTSLLAGLAIGGGLMLLVIPGIIVATMVVAAVPTTAVERLGPGAALKRSAKLTEGYRGQIFGALFIVGIVNGLPHFLLNKLVAEKAQTLGDIQLAIYLNLGVTLLIAPVAAIAGTVIYHDLRRQKEGVDAETLAAVFS